MLLYAMLLFVTFSSPCFSYFESTELEVLPKEMNGISLETIPNFLKEWHLVTVRYRQDSNELRFVYANEIAFKEMSSLNPKYPDGAIFAKVAFFTEQDPAFISSRVPSGAKRYQIMKRDQKKYRESDGWGYALFNAKGKTFGGDEKSNTMACVACHRIVPERDFVFSRQLQMEVGNIFQSRQTEAKSLNHFEQKPVKDAGPLLQELAGKTLKVDHFVGEIQKHAFSGTLDEIIPFLKDHSMREKKISVFSSIRITFLS